MSPAVVMQKTSWYQNLTTIQGQTRCTTFSVLQRIFFLVWSGVAFDRWPHACKIRVLRRVFQVVALQACPRAIATVTKRSGSQTHTCASFVCMHFLHWPLPPLWGSRISAESPVLLSSNPFCSACGLMLRSQPRILDPLEIFLFCGTSSKCVIAVTHDKQYQKHPRCYEP